MSELRARLYLTGKRYTKARNLAKALNISSQKAGQLLSVLPEWIMHTPTRKNRARRVWKRVSDEYMKDALDLLLIAIIENEGVSE